MNILKKEYPSRQSDSNTQKGAILRVFRGRGQVDYMAESTTFLIVADSRMTVVFFYDPCNALHAQSVNTGGGFHCAESSSTVGDGLCIAGVFDSPDFLA